MFSTIRNISLPFYRAHFQRSSQDRPSSAVLARALRDSMQRSAFEIDQPGRERFVSGSVLPSIQIVEHGLKGGGLVQLFPLCAALRRLSAPCQTEAMSRWVSGGSLRIRRSLRRLPLSRARLLSRCPKWRPCYLTSSVGREARHDDEGSKSARQNEDLAQNMFLV
jgi:hypothetical protein